MRAERFDVVSDVASVPVVRRAASAAMRAWVADDVLDAAELAVSELVGNAVLHGQPPVQLVVAPCADEGSVRIEVHDGSRSLPVRARTRLEGLTGRGLGLIDAVAATWGVDATSEGKVVWAELTPASVVSARPGDLSVDQVLAGFGEATEEGGERRYTVTLGDVPTDLLLEAKAHIESMIRELTLSAAGARAGMTTALPPQRLQLVHDVVEEFAEARRAITAQALAAVDRGESRTKLVLTLPASAADSGLRYLAALEQTDAYAREARLLTLAAPPQHRAFRRWYIGCLVEALRRAVAGLTPVAPPSFETHLLREIDHLAALQQVSERSARLQRATAALSGALGRAEVAGIVLEEAAAELGAARAALLVPGDDDGGRVVSATGWPPERLAALLDAWRRGDALPCTTALTTGQPVWLETRAERDEQFPSMSAVDAATAAACAVPMSVAGHVVGVLSLEFYESRLLAEDERAFLRALAAVGAQAFERADLYEAQTELASRLGRLQAVTSALTSAQTTEQVLDVVMEHATGLVGARNAALCLLADDGHSVDTARVVPPLVGADQRWRRFDLEDEAPAAEAMRTGTVVYAATIAERDRRWPGMSRFARDFEHSLICLPLHGQDGAVGAVNLSFPADPDRAPDLSFLRSFADACGQALQRAGAAERARAASARLTFLARASQELSESLDVERTLARVARLAVPELADWCVVHLLQDGELRALAAEHVDPDRTALAQEAQRRWPERISDPGGVGQVVRTGEPVLVKDIDETIAQITAAGMPLPERDPEQQEVLDSLGLNSVLIVPLTARERILGALTFITAESDRRYDDDDLAFALDLARRAAVALDNARLFTAAAERAVQTGLGAEAGDARRDVEQTARLLETMTDAFFRLDRAWRFVYVNSQAERMLRRGREELLGRDIWQEFPDGAGGPFEEHYDRALVTGRPTAFEAYFDPLDTWFEVRASPDPDGLSVFFHDVTVRKRAEQEREQAAERLGLLAEATRELVGALDPEAVLERLTSVLVPRLGDWAVAVLVDDARHAVVARSAHRDSTRRRALDAAVRTRISDLLGFPRVAGVVATGQPALVPADELAAAGAQLGAEELLAEVGAGSALVVPVRSGATVLGVIVVASGEQRAPLDLGDLDTAADIGARAGLALQNALLFERQRTAVEVLQRSLLSGLPQPAALEVAARYRAAAQEAQVGGDWYDAFLQPDGSTVLVIGDVMGHDMGAAAAMGQLRSLLRGTAFDRQESPARVLSRVDGALRGLHIDTLATALVARVEQEEQPGSSGRRTLRWSSAGHLPAVLRRADGSVLALASQDDLLLGLDPGAPRHDATVALETGDTVLLYTDGLVERRDSTITDGVARLLSELEQLGGLPLEELCDALLTRLLPDRADDDVALVAVRARPVLAVPEPARSLEATAGR